MRQVFSIVILVLAFFVGFVGDLVYSYDTITGTVEQKEVTAVFVRESDHINYLTILDDQGREQVIETTDSHPFWVVTDEPDLSRAARSVVDENGVWLYHENVGPTEHGFWVEAKDLREGDVVLGANGESSTLIAVERVVFPEGIKVYNFTVDGNHNYFVIAQTGEYGQTCVLVHNAKYQSKGRHTPNNAAEAAAKQKVIDNPTIGRELPITMKDANFPAGEGYRKFEYKEGNIIIHYVRNIFDIDPPKAIDVKFKNH